MTKSLTSAYKPKSSRSLATTSSGSSSSSTTSTLSSLASIVSILPSPLLLLLLSVWLVPRDVGVMGLGAGNGTGSDGVGSARGSGGGSSMNTTTIRTPVLAMPNAVAAPTSTFEIKTIE